MWSLKWIISSWLRCQTKVSSLDCFMDMLKLIINRTWMKQKKDTNWDLLQMSVCAISNETEI